MQIARKDSLSCTTEHTTHQHHEQGDASPKGVARQPGSTHPPPLSHPLLAPAHASISVTIHREHPAPSLQHFPPPWLLTLSGGVAPSVTRVRKPRHLHEGCGGLLQWRCVGSGKRGGYYKRRRHILHCRHCSPDRSDALQEERAIRKENRMEVIESKEDGHFYRITPLHARPSPSPQTMC